MKFTVLAFLTFIACNAFSQVGRYEQPTDTIPIGGKTQEDQALQLGSEKELVGQLQSLRDSVNTFLTDKNNMHKNVNLSQRKKQLDQMLQSLERSGNDEALLKQGYTLLHEVRADLKGQ